MPDFDHFLAESGCDKYIALVKEQAPLQKEYRGAVTIDGKPIGDLLRVNQNDKECRVTIIAGSEYPFKKNTPVTLKFETTVTFSDKKESIQRFEQTYRLNESMQHFPEVQIKRLHEDNKKYACYTLELVWTDLEEKRFVCRKEQSLRDYLKAHGVSGTETLSEDTKIHPHIMTDNDLSYFRSIARPHDLDIVILPGGTFKVMNLKNISPELALPTQPPLGFASASWQPTLHTALPTINHIGSNSAVVAMPFPVMGLEATTLGLRDEKWLPTHVEFSLNLSGSIGRRYYVEFANHTSYLRDCLTRITGLEYQEQPTWSCTYTLSSLTALKANCQTARNSALDPTAWCFENVTAACIGGEGNTITVKEGKIAFSLESVKGELWANTLRGGPEHVLYPALSAGHHLLWHFNRYGLKPCYIKPEHRHDPQNNKLTFWQSDTSLTYDGTDISIKAKGKVVTVANVVQTQARQGCSTLADSVTIDALSKLTLNAKQLLANGAQSTTLGSGIKVEVKSPAIKAGMFATTGGPLTPPPPPKKLSPTDPTQPCKDEPSSSGPDAQLPDARLIDEGKGKAKAVPAA